VDNQQKAMKKKEGRRTTPNAFSIRLANTINSLVKFACKSEFLPISYAATPMSGQFAFSTLDLRGINAPGNGIGSVIGVTRVWHNWEDIVFVGIPK